jgi:hypothetical protein
MKALLSSLLMTCGWGCGSLGADARIAIDDDQQPPVVHREPPADPVAPDPIIVPVIEVEPDPPLIAPAPHELGQDLCATLVTLSQRMSAGPELLRGERESVEVYHTPLWLPGAEECRLYRDERPFYACTMRTDLPSLERSVDACLSGPGPDRVEPGRLSEWAQRAVRITLLGSGGSVSLSLMRADP